MGTNDAPKTLGAMEETVETVIKGVNKVKMFKLLAAGAAARVVIIEVVAVSTNHRTSGNSPRSAANGATAKPVPVPSRSAKPAADPNREALATVKAFDTAPVFQGNDYTTQAWEDYIAPVSDAADEATDPQLQADLLNYHTDLLMNGSNAYERQALADLTSYARTVYGVDVFPGG